MTAVWSLTISTADCSNTTIDSATSHEDAATAALAAALDAALDARSGALPQRLRYELRAGGELVALVQTGAAEHSGCPDHAGVVDLIRRIEAARDLSVMTPR